MHEFIHRNPSDEYLSGTWVDMGYCTRCLTIGEMEEDHKCPLCWGVLWHRGEPRKWSPPVTRRRPGISTTFPFFTVRTIVVKEGYWERSDINE